MKNLDHTYYGFEREDDQRLLRVERAAETEQRQLLCTQWDEKHQGAAADGNVESESSEDEEAELQRKAAEEKKFEEDKAKAAAQEQLRLEQKKKELLARLANE